MNKKKPYILKYENWSQLLDIEIDRSRLPLYIETSNMSLLDLHHLMPAIAKLHPNPNNIFITAVAHPDKKKINCPVLMIYVM